MYVVMQCMKNPVPIGVGYLAQYIVKPLLGFCIAKVGSISALTFQMRHHGILHVSSVLSRAAVPVDMLTHFKHIPCFNSDMTWYTRKYC